MKNIMIDLEKTMDYLEYQVADCWALLDTYGKRPERYRIYNNIAVYSRHHFKLMMVRRGQLEYDINYDIDKAKKILKLYRPFVKDF